MATKSSPNRPEAFKITVQGGMLDALGVNMYTTIGKCLVEFAANSYDSNSNGVKIEIPFERIVKERAELRGAANKEVEAGKRNKHKLLLDPLPDSVAIIISDTGHGMTPEEIQTKFLPLNRNRRLDGQPPGNPNHFSEGGLRRVMGRKGLGKMAAFGAAERVTVWSKRKGETFATEFTMDYASMSKNTEVSDAVFKAKYHDGLPAKESGTKLTLSKLRCDALQSSSETIESILLENFFGILDSDFPIILNGRKLSQKEVDYEFFFPAKRGQDGFAKTDIQVTDLSAVSLKYFITFRARRDDLSDEEKKDKEKWESRRPLDTKQRGARIYVNNRLALGPSLLDLPTGMHNFHAQSYLECVVHADQLDEFDIDFVNTSRSDLRRDNEVVDKLISSISDLMFKAVMAHSEFRGTWVSNKLKDNQLGSSIITRLDRLPKKTQRPARKIIETVAREYGVASQEFNEIAPLLLESMNAGEVLMKLIHVESDPQDLMQVIEALKDLAVVEQQDVLKLYRARKDGIDALSKLIDVGKEHWMKRQNEGELHLLLKRNPWLIKSEYSRYLTSDQPMADVARTIAQELKIHNFAEQAEKDWEKKRPDLVFPLVEPSGGLNVSIVELKSPAKPMDADNLLQLDGYVEKVRELLEREYPESPAMVSGHLIGAMPALNSANDKQKMLIRKIRQHDLPRGIEVSGLRDLVRRAQRNHELEIKVLEFEDAAVTKKEKRTQKKASKQRTAKVPHARPVRQRNQG